MMFVSDSMMQRNERIREQMRFLRVIIVLMRRIKFLAFGNLPLISSFTPIPRLSLWYLSL